MRIFDKHKFENKIKQNTILDVYLEPPKDYYPTSLFTITISPIFYFDLTGMKLNIGHFNLALNKEILKKMFLKKNNS